MLLTFFSTFPLEIHIIKVETSTAVANKAKNVAKTFPPKPISLDLLGAVKLNFTLNKHPVERREMEEKCEHPTCAVNLVKHRHRHICR